MTTNSTKLSVTPIGRAVARSILHPVSANQLIEFAAYRADELLTLSQDEADERTFRYVLMHAVYSSYEYSRYDSTKNLPYQLKHLVQNTLADRSESHLIERPWRRNPKAANAAMLAVRWAEGQPRNELAREFPPIGSGTIQTMIREGVDILFAWSECLIAGTMPHLIDEDRPEILRDGADSHRVLRNLASGMRMHAHTIAAGLPGEVAWIARLMVPGTSRRFLSRHAILALLEHGLTDPVSLLRYDMFKEIIRALTPIGITDLDSVVKDFQKAVRVYRKEQRQNIWRTAIDRAPHDIKALLEDMVDAREKSFEKKIENLLDVVGISYKFLDDGKTPGAADLHVGLNHQVQVVIELKTAKNDGTIGLNEATDVIKGAAIVDLADLPKVTLANPGFDPNVPWQARRVKDLALLEACQFAYGISFLARGEIDENGFLDWLTQPGMLSVSSLHTRIQE